MGGYFFCGKVSRVKSARSAIVLEGFFQGKLSELKNVRPRAGHIDKSGETQFSYKSETVLSIIALTVR